MGGSGPICLATGSHLGQVVKLQDYPCRGITLSAPSAPTCVVLGSRDHVKSDSLVPVQPALSTILSDSSQESVKLDLHAWLLEPQQSRSRASLGQWQ